MLRVYKSVLICYTYIMKRTYKKTTTYTGKVNKNIREWIEKLKSGIYYDETHTDSRGNKHRLIIREGEEFRVRESVNYGN